MYWYRRSSHYVEANQMIHAKVKFYLFHLEDSYVQENVIDPAAKGTLNVLKSCLKANSVKRVIFTSSISTMTAKDSSGKWRPVVDESCNIPTEHVWHTKPSGWVCTM